MSCHEHEPAPHETLFEDALQINSGELDRDRRRGSRAAATSSQDGRTQRRLKREQTSQEAEAIAQVKLARGVVTRDEFEQIASTLARARNVSSSSVSEDDSGSSGGGDAHPVGLLDEMTSDKARGVGLTLEPCQRESFQSNRVNDGLGAAMVDDKLDNEASPSASDGDGAPDPSSKRPQSTFVEQTAVIEFLNATLSAIQRRTRERRRPPTKSGVFEQMQSEHEQLQERPVASPKHNSISSYCEVRILDLQTGNLKSLMERRPFFMHFTPILSQ